ncbi:MAG: hypothetical protein ABW206_16570, partial [Agrobacterium vaccinii]
MLTSKYRDSRLATGFFPGRKAENWSPIISRSIELKSAEISLENFSFIENAQGVGRALAQLCEFEMNCSDIRINFKDKECLDIGAYLVLAALKK